MPGRAARDGPGWGHAFAVGAVDLGLIVGVLAWGLHTHNMEPVEMPIHTVGTVAPFLVGWMVWAPVLGSYRRRTRTECRRGLGRVGAAWLAAAITGALIRATPILAGEAPVIFVMVVFGIGATVLLPWRALVCFSARA